MSQPPQSRSTLMLRMMARIVPLHAKDVRPSRFQGVTWTMKSRIVTAATKHANRRQTSMVPL
eukprot:4800782-Amphidinium_carterae.1